MNPIQERLCLIHHRHQRHQHQQQQNKKSRLLLIQFL
jgi:hypothetical protein